MRGRIKKYGRRIQTSDILLKMHKEGKEMRQVKFVLYGKAYKVWDSLKTMALIAPNILVKDLGNGLSK